MPTKLEVRYYVDPDADAVNRRAAGYFVERVRSAAAQRGKARVAISGGSTPKRAFALLGDAAEPFRALTPWDKLELYWVDERCVPPDHPDSNFGMTQQALLSKAPLDSSQIFRIRGELAPEAAAAEYEAEIRHSFRLEGAETPVFDMIWLGMGPDGHTASLFPHSAALHEWLRIAVANHVEQKEAWRVTLTLPVLNHGRDLCFLIEGTDKAKVLREVLLGDYAPETLPSQLIRPRGGVVTLLLDAAAAALLPPPGPDGLGRLEIAR
jgi:6-phosphogluconolactonase